MSTKAADRLDALKGLLKDPPKKLSLQKERDVPPPLGVIQHSSIRASLHLLSIRRAQEREEGEEGEGEEGEEGEERYGGFQPGPYRNRSLKNSCNIIPIGRPKGASIASHSQPFR